MNIEDLHNPIWLIRPSLKSKERIDHLHYLKIATKLSVQEKTLCNHYLLDSTKRIFKIIEIKDLGNYNKPWMFEFFNPMRKIELVLEEVEDDIISQQINKLLKEPDKNDF